MLENVNKIRVFQKQNFIRCYLPGRATYNQQATFAVRQEKHSERSVLYPDSVPKEESYPVRLESRRVSYQHLVRGNFLDLPFLFYNFSESSLC